MLGLTLRHKWATIVVGVVVFGTSLFGASFLKPTFIPEIDQGYSDMALTLPPGSALSYTDAAARRIEERLLARPEVDSVLTNVGGSGTPEAASFYVKLKPKRYTVIEFTAAARRDFSDQCKGLSINPLASAAWPAAARRLQHSGQAGKVTLQTVGSPDELVGCLVARRPAAQCRALMNVDIL